MKAISVSKTLQRILIGFGATLLSLGVATGVEAANTTKTSSGAICTIVGTSQNNTLTGTSGKDVICGLGGNDTINGLGGDDVIDAGTGNDVVNGGDGNDTILGGVGDDKLRGDSGNDSFYGDVGNDILTGGLGDDTLRGGEGSDSISGDGGNDIEVGGVGDDSLAGGLGDDSVSGEGGNDTIQGGEGADILYGNDGLDVITGDEGNDKVNGGSGNDTLSGSAGDDSLVGDSGNDSETGGEGADVMQGGDGNDNLQGGAGSDSFFGDGGNDVLAGGEGNDTLRGGDGLDSVSGESGNDTITGGLGNDTLSGGIGDDTVSGETGNDKINGGDGVDNLNGNGGDDAVSGDSGNDVLSGGDGADSMAGGLGDDSVLGGAGNDALGGGLGNDSMAGGDGNDSMAGGDGNDRLLGDAGNDTLKGETGNDGMIGGAGTDILAGANGAPAPTERNLCERDLQDTVTYCGFDENAPWVASAELSRTSVDSSSSAQTIVVTMHVTDELMGVEYAGCSVTWDGARVSNGYDRAVRISGDAIDGFYTCNVTIPFGGSHGRWGLNLDTRDRAGNLGLANQGPTGKWHSNLPEIMDQTPEHWIEQTGVGDSESPRILNPGFNVSEVDTSASEQTVTIEMRITDDFIGVDRVQCAPRHGIAIDFNPGYGGAIATLKSGDSMDGIWMCSMKLPRGAGHGRWGAAIFASDKTGKQYYIESDKENPSKWNVDDTSLLYVAPPVTFDTVNFFTQTGAGDDTLPVMLSISLDKENINTSSSEQVVNATVTLGAEQYGKPRFVMFDVFSPSTMAEHQATCTLTSTNLDGSTVWNCKFTIGLGSPKGLHPIMVWIADDAGNRNEYRVDTETLTWYTNFESEDGTISQLTGLNLGPVGVINGE